MVQNESAGDENLHVQMYKCFPGCYSPFFKFASYINQIVFTCLVDWLYLILRN